ncbi:MAG TPA: hypothetical protein VH684_28715 [Xanthobacteraceae bacterium]|jgi:hypothetical protein
MKQLLFALGVLIAQIDTAIPASRTNEMTIPTAARVVTADGSALNAQAWVPLRHQWGWRYYRRRWPPECVVGWEHFYWWGHRYSCYRPRVKRYVHFDRRAEPH